MSGDLNEQLSEMIGKHEFSFGYDTNCRCGAAGVWFWDDYRAHLAQVISDHLIDLAGTGKLLASIDRMYR